MFVPLRLGEQEDAALCTETVIGTCTTRWRGRHGCRAAGDRIRAWCCVRSQCAACATAQRRRRHRHATRVQFFLLQRLKTRALVRNITSSAFWKPCFNGVVYPTCRLACTWLRRRHHAQAKTTRRRGPSPHKPGLNIDVTCAQCGSMCTAVPARSRRRGGSAHRAQSAGSSRRQYGRGDGLWMRCDHVQCRRLLRS